MLKIRVTNISGISCPYLLVNIIIKYNTGMFYQGASQTVNLLIDFRFVNNPCVHSPLAELNFSILVVFNSADSHSTHNDV